MARTYAPREYTEKVIELAQEGVLDWETIARECMCRMSEDDVMDMATECEWVEIEDEDEDEDLEDEDSEDEDLEDEDSEDEDLEDEPSDND